MAEDGQMKRCTGCDIVRPLGAFSNSRSTRDGKAYQCKGCNRRYREENKERIREMNARWRRENAEALRRKAAERYAERAEIVNARCREYYNANAERIRAQKAVYRSENSEAVKAANGAYRSANPDRKRDSDLRSRYGISLNDYNAMLDAQDWRCANPSCDVEHVEGRRLAVDHDHSCCADASSCGDCIRGLLCTACNSSLGLAGDDVERLLGLVMYLMAGRIEFPRPDKGHPYSADAIGIVL